MWPASQKELIAPPWLESRDWATRLSLHAARCRGVAYYKYSLSISCRHVASLLQTISPIYRFFNFFFFFPLWAFPFREVRNLDAGSHGKCLRSRFGHKNRSSYCIRSERCVDLRFLGFSLIAIGTLERMFVFFREDSEFFWLDLTVWNIFPGSRVYDERRMDWLINDSRALVLWIPTSVSRYQCEFSLLI